MNQATKPRQQCAKCPWKKSTDPHVIPGGYCETKHANLKDTIADPGMVRFDSVRMMACHEFPVGKEQPCVGWLYHQLGVGNNLGLRMMAISGRLPKFEIMGEQHDTFEDTLPKPKKRRRKA